MVDEQDDKPTNTPEDAPEETPTEVENPVLTRLREIAAQNRPGAAEAEDRRRAKLAHKGVNILRTIPEEARKFKDVAELLKKELTTKARLEPKIRIKEESRQKALTARAVNEVARETSEEAISGEITRRATSAEAQLAATSMLTTPNDELVRQQREKMTRLQEIGEEQKQHAADLILRKTSDADKYPGMKEKSWEGIKQNVAEAEGIKSELAKIAAALGQQKAQGLDPKSKMQDLITKSEQAKDIVKDVELKKELESGQGLGALTHDELKDKETKAAEDLVRAMKELKEATDDQKKEKQQKAESAKEELEKVQAAIAAPGAPPPPPERGRLDTLSAYADVARAGFGAVASATQQIGVNHQLAMAQNTTGLADFENQKYQTYKAAAGGDIASLMQLSQFSQAEEFGGGLRTAANIAVGAEGLAGGVQTAVGTAETATALNPVADFLNTGGEAQVVEGGMKNIAGGLATSMVAAHDLGYQVSGTQADLAGRQARMDVSRAVNAVGAEQVQGFRDFSVGMGTAAIGMGAKGEDFLKETISDANMQRMAAARISPEQMTQMAQMGQSQMGSMFNENQIFNARSMEQRGLGTMQENMQRTAALASAGANNPTASLGAITEAAITKGLDSSKALNAVVEHTATMAASSAGRAMGLDTTAAAATLLTAGITKDTPNKEAALEHAADVQQIARGIGTNIGANYAGMVSMARTQQTLGIGGVQAVAAESIDTETLMAINEEKDPKKKIRRLQELGVNLEGQKDANGKPKDVNAQVASMLENRQTKLLEAGGKGLIFNNRAELQKRVNSAKSIDDLSGADVTELGDIARFSGMTGGAKDMFGTLKGVKTPVANETFGPQAPTDQTMLGKLDKQRTAGFEQLSTAAATGASALGGATAAVNKLTDAFSKLISAMPSVEKEATTAGGKAAAGEKGMNMNISGFNDAIDKLNKVLNNALTKSGVGTGSMDSKQRPKPPGP